jgi:hypothetical protein
MAIEDAKLFRNDINALIVDLTSAFYTIDHDCMLWIINDLDLPTDVTDDAVRNIYDMPPVKLISLPGV